MSLSPAQKMPLNESVVLTIPAEGVLVVTLNRPDQRNALDRGTVGGMNDALDWAIRNEIRAVVLTGSPPAFSAGGDLRGYVELYRDAAQFAEFLSEFHDLNEKLESSTILSIAAINGICVAGGLELVLACDLAVMAESARIGDAHIGTWQLPGAGGSQRLARQIGLGMAKRLLFTGELLTADEAVRCGIATRAVPDSDLMKHAVALASKVVQAPRATITAMKKLLKTAADEPLTSGLSTEMRIVAEYTSAPGGPASQGLTRFFART